MTRLLKTAIIGIPAEIADSSWIDMLAGLSKSGNFRTPPAFWAHTGAAPIAAISNPAAAALARRFRAISPTSPVLGAHLLGPRDVPISRLISRARHPPSAS